MLEATMRFPADFDSSTRGGVVFGNFYDADSVCVSLEIYKSDSPRLYMIDGVDPVAMLFFSVVGTAAHPGGCDRLGDRQRKKT